MRKRKHNDTCAPPYNEVETRTKNKTVLFLAAGLLTTATSHATIISNVSVDFLGEDQAGMLAPPELAGVVVANQWQAAVGNTGGITPMDSSFSDTIDVSWSAPKSGIIPGNNFSTSDRLMMQGFIASTLGPSGATIPAVVKVSSIDLPILGWDSYDVYVYSDTGLNGPTSSITLTGGPPPTTLAHTEHIPGFGTPGFDSYLDSQTLPDGNYLVFEGLTSNSFAIVAESNPSLSEMAAINGIQIVGRAIPEPSTAAVSLMSLIPLLMRRRR